MLEHAYSYRILGGTMAVYGFSVNLSRFKRAVLLLDNIAYVHS